MDKKLQKITYGDSFKFNILSQVFLVWDKTPPYNEIEKGN